jgi:2-polyprenyl-3-methyl-5-hydroxy-6-metoxy-1,4-benzoquinol methylase
LFEQINYDLVLILEVLEHLNNDVEILTKIKSKSKVIFSVPNFDSESHVRFFLSKEEIYYRYQEYIKIETMKSYYISDNTDKKIYIVYGFKK